MSLVGAPALTSAKAYIDAAVSAGVKRFIPRNSAAIPRLLICR